MSLKVVVKRDDGSEHEITEGVQCLYDAVIGSMDWGSGFFSFEDALPIYLLAKECGFQGFEEGEKYLKWVVNKETEKAQRGIGPHTKGLTKEQVLALGGDFDKWIEFFKAE